MLSIPVGDRWAQVLHFAGFVLDPDRGELRGSDGLAIRLRPKAFELLKLLAANSNRVLGKQDLMEAVWPGIYVGEDSLFQCIREIRTALGDTQRHMIKVVSGRGYVFAVDVSVRPDCLDTHAAGEDSVSETAVAVDLTGSRRRFHMGRISAFWALGIPCVIAAALAFAISSHKLGNTPKPSQSTIEILPIVTAIADPQNTALAQGITAELINGLAGIDGIRLIIPEKQPPPAVAGSETDRPSQADFLLQGELQRSSQSWIFQTRLINVASREIETVAEVKLDAKETDKQLLASRLAAGAGYALANRLNKFAETAGASKTAAAGIAIQQATASINQTSQERFATARTILEKNLASEPGNVDLQIALATLHLRGIQMAWYGPDESKAAEGAARSLLERALQSRPNSIPVLGAYCRFLTVTNQFTESLVACARALSVNPWDGTALFHLGLTQLQLGRFGDALATFEQADRVDTPEVSRWTWLLGAGWADLLVGRNDDAVPWLQRSIAITSGSGRIYMLLAVAYQRLGRSDEAKQALAKGMELRPGSTAANISLPFRNASPKFLEEGRKIRQILIEIGLPVDDSTQKPTDRDQ